MVHVLNEVSHDRRLALAHEVTGPSFREMVRDATSGSLSSVVFWTSSEKTQKIREILFTRGTSGSVSTITKKQFDATGVLQEEETFTLTRNAQNRVASLTVTKTL